MQHNFIGVNSQSFVQESNKQYQSLGYESPLEEEDLRFWI